MDDDDVSSLSDGEAEATLVPTALPLLPSRESSSGPRTQPTLVRCGQLPPFLLILPSLVGVRFHGSGLFLGFGRTSGVGLALAESAAVVALSAEQSLGAACERECG